MRVVSLPDAQPRDRHVAIGTFDGVHVGHRQVIDDADTVLTFEPHPLAVLHPDAMPKLIMPFAIKRDVIAGLGVSELVTIPFDKTFAGLDPQEFIDQILVARLGATRVSVGQNFRFGRKAAGDTATLEAHPAFETRVVEIVDEGQERVSSTRIRALIASGAVDEARELLGEPYLFEGEVIHGDARGRELGYPTANLAPADELVVPGHGIYAAFAGGRPAAVNVGVRPTFGEGKSLLIEVYVLDFDGDLYGQTLRIAFVERLRGERWFAGADELREQMAHDVQRTREVCERFTRA
ncbi:MAG: bifunctional riboflavin kinase/FAD synthetase [Solirubrobacterales bacterium]